VATESILFMITKADIIAEAECLDFDNVGFATA